MCVHIIFSSVSVAEWPLFGKLCCSPRLTICYLLYLTICNMIYFPFVGFLRAGFEFVLLQFLIFAYFLLFFKLVGTGAFVCCLVHRGSTDYLLLLQIFKGVV